MGNMGPVVCGNKTFNAIVASLLHNAENGGHYVLRHAIKKNFPGLGDNPGKLAWRLYAMNLASLVRSYGAPGARELIEEKFKYEAAEPHDSIVGLYQSIRYLRQQCTDEDSTASGLYRKLGDVLTAAAHEIAMAEAKKAGIPLE